MSLPDNLPAIRAQGWKYVNSKVCGCSRKFEWHKRWSEEKQKFEFMPIEFDEMSGKFLNHYILCTQRDQHRKKKANPDGLSQKQRNERKKKEKEAEREALKGPSLFGDA